MWGLGLPCGDGKSPLGLGQGLAAKSLFVLQQGRISRAEEICIALNIPYQGNYGPQKPRPTAVVS